jgi:hypothetical protein
LAAAAALLDARDPHLIGYALRDLSAQRLHSLGCDWGPQRARGATARSADANYGEKLSLRLGFS